MIRILIIVLIVLVGAAALTSLNPSADKTTNPIVEGLATVQSWFKGPSAPKLPGTDTASDTLSDKKETKVYKWQDDAGEWHFSNRPPPAGVASSIKTYRSDANITQAPPPIVEKETKQTASDIPESSAAFLPITDPERVKQLIEDAKNVQNLVDNRQKTVDEGVEP